MYKTVTNRHNALRFKQFNRKGYSLFASIGREVIIGTLSVSTLTFAKAESISAQPIKHDSIQGNSKKEILLDEVSVTGSRVPMTALQSAKIVTVITREDIERANAESINDLLKMATGVDVRQRSGFGVQTDISIDGGTFDQITILLNGINISNPHTGHLAADFPVDLKDIERIEVLEGASARVFGCSAFSGAVNIITKCGNKSGIRVGTEGGSFGTFGTSVSGNFAKGAWHNSLSGGYQQSDGGTDNSDFKRRRTFYEGAYNSNRLDLQWQTGLSSQDYGANTFYTAKFNNQYEENRRYLASVTCDFKLLENNKLHIIPTLYWNRNKDHYQLVRNTNYGENYHCTDVLGAGINSHIKWVLGKTALGAEVRHESILSTALGELLDSADFKKINGTDKYYSHKAHRTSTNIYLEHDILLRQFTISAGVLASHNTGLDNNFRFYPGVDISYRPSDNWKIYASWNKALRMPTYTDLYISNSVQIGDVNLKPERNSVFKTGVRYQGYGIEGVVSGFYSRGRDMIDWVYQTSLSTKYKAMNIGKLDNEGLSTDWTFHIPEIINNSNFFITQIKFGYAYLYQRHETDQEIFKSLYALEYLKHKFTTTVDHKIWNKLSASWSLRWQQRMNGYSPYTKIDCKIQWKTDKYDLYVKADNITNHRYYDLTDIRQPGIWIMAGGNFTIDL
jgi:vitamin B12 transporter